MLFLIDVISNTLVPFVHKCIWIFPLINITWIYVKPEAFYISSAALPTYSSPSLDSLPAIKIEFSWLNVSNCNRFTIHCIQVQLWWKTIFSHSPHLSYCERPKKYWMSFLLFFLTRSIYGKIFAVNRNIALYFWQRWQETDLANDTRWIAALRTGDSAVHIQIHTCAKQSQLSLSLTACTIESQK